MADGALVDIGQHRIGATEGQQRRLGKEPGHLCQLPIPAIQAGQQRHGQQPQQRPHRQQQGQTRRAKAGVGGGRRIVVKQRRAIGLARRAMPAAQAELLRQPAPTEITQQSGAQYDQWKRQVEGKDGDKGRRRQAPQPVVFQRPRADAPGRLGHDGGNRRLDPVEDPRHQRHITIGDIHPAQADQDKQRGQHEQHPGDHPAPGAMQQPADIGGQLLGLRAGQQHAVVERMQKAPLGQPAALLHQFLVHDGDLAGRAAEADQAQLEPEQEGFEQTNGTGRLVIRQGSRHGRRSQQQGGQAL